MQGKILGLNCFVHALGREMKPGAGGKGKRCVQGKMHERLFKAISHALGGERKPHPAGRSHSGGRLTFEVLDSFS